MERWKFPVLASTLIFLIFIGYLILSPGIEKPHKQNIVAETNIERVKQVRNVTDDSILQAPKLQDDYLERLPAIIALPSPKRPAPSNQFKRPHVIAAGILKIGQDIVSLADIDPVPLDLKCNLKTGETWPCGMLARTEMRRFVRGRPIECDAASEDGQSMMKRCRLDSYDMSAWLVLTGWAKPHGNLFTEELAEARTHQRGIWRQTKR